MINNSFRMVDAMNTHNPALITLKEMGYELGIYPPERDEDEVEVPQTEIGHWWAQKYKHEFVASDPLSLLGIVSIWEHRGDKWINEDDPDVSDRILSEIYGDE